MLLTTINGINVAEHPMARYLLDAGFHAAPIGFNVRRNLPSLPGVKEAGTSNTEAARVGHA
jgi:ATP-dependent Lhr-like helicase